MMSRALVANYPASVVSCLRWLTRRCTAVSEFDENDDDDGCGSDASSIRIIHNESWQIDRR